jgi:hypothetical protein
MTTIAFARPARRVLAPAVALAGALALTACYSPGERAAGGGIIGGLGGAAVGAALSGGLAGPAIAGAAVGAASGAIIGAATAPSPRRHRYY